MSLLPSYKQLWEKKYGKPLSSQEEAVEMPVWNALLDQTIEHIARAKNDLILAGDYQAAAVARVLAEALQSLKGDVAAGAEEGGAAAS